MGINEEGLLWISGPNVMSGYLNQTEKTNEVLVDGWYNTGDIARIDEEGFVEITGRQSRFSKIGGEMVPHVRIENTLAKIIDDNDPVDGEDDNPLPRVAVSAVPDEKKENVLLFCTCPSKYPSISSFKS